ncbi:MarR family winged helix-turn-helix transcriptional regulator [Nonomuraea sp. NPDC050556]|uniref:MarR family winged helix-turn-helix transcriptional regulator n=1 Tax=Nonomuraea sp. NPDC050556 TaxID=3364369 RepID=UPI0037A706A7
MTESPEDQALATALVSLSHHVLQLFADVGRASKLSQQQVELICAIVVRDRVGMSELGRIMHLEKSNLSNLVDRMEQRGLVVRSRDPEDRRVTWVKLTDEGMEQAIRSHTEVTARMTGLINQLDVKDRTRLTSVIEQMMSVA